MLEGLVMTKMKRLLFICLFFIGVAFAATEGLAQGAQLKAASDDEAWYKVVTGIVAIPGAIVGLIISFNVLRKTTLESRKLELEIREKESKLQNEEQGQDTYPNLARPVSNAQIALLLIVRYIILELTLRLWSVVPSAVGYVTDSIPLALYLTLGKDFFRDTNLTSMPVLTTVIIPRLVSVVFSLVYWFMVFGFGWPLLKDTCRYLGIPMSGLLDLPYIGKRSDPLKLPNATNGDEPES
jgi:hypothetical protein